MQCKSDLKHMSTPVKLIKQQGCVGKQIQENKNFLLMTSPQRGQLQIMGCIGWEGEALEIS